MFHVTLLGYIVSLGVLAIAIGYGRRRFRLGGALAYTFGYFMGLVPFTIWILTAPLGVAGFRQEYLSRAGGGSLWLRFLDERHRYSDFLGINVLHGHGLDAIPVRLPIVLCFLGATILLWKLRRNWFYLELVLLTPTIFWLIYTVNKTSRYLVLMAPIIALSMAAAVAVSSRSRRLHRVCMVLVCLVIMMQTSANYFLLHSARSANYDRVTTELQSAIPSGEPVYGTITFWMALHDRPYISYERTDPQMAADQYRVRYFIAGDRVMVNGLPGDEEFYRKLNKSMGEIEAQSKLIRQFHDQYYGDLKVYELDPH
jgi:hypothetical protein